MPYQNLDLPRLRTHAYPEADLVKASSGVDFDTPTLAFMTEGNRRVLRKSDYPALTSIEEAFPRGGGKLGTHIINHNLVLIQPNLPEDTYRRVVIHEGAHALRAHLRDYKPYKDKTALTDLNFGDIAAEHFGWQIYEEGFARYWEATTIGTQVQRLSTRDLREFHKQLIDKQLKAIDSIDPVKVGILERAGLAAYPTGQYVIAKLMSNLEPVVGRQKAIELIGKAEPRSPEEILGIVDGIQSPKFIDLSWINRFRYSAHAFMQPAWERVF